MCQWKTGTHQSWLGHFQKPLSPFGHLWTFWPFSLWVSYTGNSSAIGKYWGFPTIRWIIQFCCIEIPILIWAVGKKLWVIVSQKFKDGNGTHTFSDLGMGALITPKTFEIGTPNLEGKCQTIRWMIFENLVAQKCRDGNGTPILYINSGISFTSLFSHF